MSPPPPVLTFLKVVSRASAVFLSTGKWTRLHLGFRVEPGRVPWCPSGCPKSGQYGKVRARGELLPRGHGEHEPLTMLVTVAPRRHQGDSLGCLEAVTPKASLEQVDSV